jgi:CDP-diacylglycerol--serine O-phosphatidyltransferase
MIADRAPAAFLHPANLLTYASVALALAAIAAAQRGSTPAAAGLIALAVIADTFDGRFARRFERGDRLARFGAELDSLADAIAFGAAPSICALLLRPSHSALADILWWSGAVWYAVCAMTRLGHYNVTDPRSGAGFVGLPAPVAALILATLMACNASAAVLGAAVVAAACAMIAPLAIPRPAGLGLAAFVAWPAFIVIVSTSTILR